MSIKVLQFFIVLLAMFSPVIAFTRQLLPNILPGKRPSAVSINSTFVIFKMSNF